MYDDYFDIKLVDGRKLLWKNFGQVITVDDLDARKLLIGTSGAVIHKEEFKFVELDFEWIIDAKQVGYGTEESSVNLTFPRDWIEISLHREYDSRMEEYPERDYFYWINDYKLYNEYVKRMGGDEDKAIDYLMKWRRPKLKTNGRINMVVYHNSTPLYVGMKDSENRKSYVDAFFRLIYHFQFLRDSGEEDVR